MKGLIDIGAHYAEEYFMIPEEERQKYDYLFFEPIKKTYAEMRGLLPSTPNIKCFNIALGNMDGGAVMFTDSTNKGQSSSILKPKLHLTEHPWVKFTGKEEVVVKRLDDIEYDRSLYDVMHIDVQGYEMEVLKGATYSLNFIDEMTVEVNKAELYEGCPMVEEIDDFLDTIGFVRVSTKWLTPLWGDATYRRIG